MSSISVTIYIEPRLLDSNYYNRGFPNGKLLISRKVLGAPNIVVVEKSFGNLADNVNFKWNQKYKIGASKTPAAEDGFVHVATRLKQIASGQMSDWTADAVGSPLQEMPDAVKADWIFLETWPQGSGGFGTRNQTYTWYNSIWCPDRDEVDWCVYAESKPAAPGQMYRGYQVTHNFEASWVIYDKDSTTILNKTSFEFSVPTTSDNLTKFLSLGRESESTHELAWLEYEKDPSGFDPSKAIVRPPPPPTKPFSIRLRLKWTGRYQDEMIKRENAQAVFDFLKTFGGGWYTLQNPLVLGDVQVDVKLEPGVAFGNYFIGNTDRDKLQLYLGTLISTLSPRYKPGVVEWIKI